MDTDKESMENIRNWVAGPPVREEMHVVGSYRSIRETPSLASNETKLTP